jgi:hypothetical protein
VGKLECFIHVPNDTRIISQSPGFVSGKWKLKRTAKFRPSLRDEEARAFRT